MENLTHRCPHCTTLHNLSLSLNNLGELHFICEHCCADASKDASTAEQSVADKCEQSPPVNLPISPPLQPEPCKVDQYDHQYLCFEATQNLLCDWLDDMEDLGYLSASEHDAMEASIFDAQPY